MKKFNLISGIPVCICVFLISCSTKIKTELPVIDVIGALKNEKSLKLSEIVDHIEYVKLETTPECLIGGGQAVLAGNTIYIKNFRPTSLLVFDGQGKFLRQISRQGKGPGEYINFAYFDVSPDNRYIAIGGFGGGIRLYTITGEFTTQSDYNSLSWSGFLFLNPNKLITYESRQNGHQKGYPIMMAWNTEHLQSDTLLCIDMEPQESDRSVLMVFNPFYPFKGRINFMEAANDTLYQLDTDLKISPRMVVDCGERALTEETLFMAPGKSIIRVYPVCETNNYLFINSYSGEDYRVFVFNKRSGETFRMPVRQSLFDEKVKTYGPENDLEGIDFTFNGLRVNDKTWTSILQIVDLKAFFESVKPDLLKLKTRKYLDQLRKLTDASDLNDNPIVRIVHLK
ncbi:MAG: 6-bladed beta-propeller [Porphyromonadaceae bacterium]|nr:MAG: 6-bladed beta-propeller [Porphyromonadaceae bacterium]